MREASQNAVEHFIDRHLEEGRGARVAFVTGSANYTYRELAANVNRAGNLLRDRGVARGDRVTIALEDGIAFAAVFFGALKIGAVPAPLSTLLTPDDYRRLLIDCEPRLLVVSDEIWSRVGPAANGLISPGRIIVSGGVALHLEAAIEIAADQLDCAAIEPEAVGFMLYSSGSTGEPKGVMHRQGDLLETARLYADGVLGIRADDVIFSASKMFFAYGLGNSCTFPLHAGARTILRAERPTPAAVMATLRDYRVTIFFGFPTLYAAILAALGDRRVSLPHLRLCVSAGEALPATIGEHWRERFGVEILDGIGSTEALHIFISNRAGEVRSDATGKAVEGYEVALRDDDGAEAAIDHIGDLWCRGPSIATGYWRKSAATARTFVDGWLRTGDKYYRDADGFFHYAGRADDMLKVGGVWVSPHEVESALIAHPAVLEAAVVGHRDEDELIKPKAFVVIKQESAAGAALAQELMQFVKERLAPYKRPRWIEFRAELPKTATGKIRRNLLRLRN